MKLMQTLGTRNRKGVGVSVQHEELGDRLGIVEYDLQELREHLHAELDQLKRAVETQRRLLDEVRDREEVAA